MARRKTVRKKEIENLTRKHLNNIGSDVIADTTRFTKVSKPNKVHLRENINYRVKKYDELTLTQFHYGRYNTPKGKPTPSDRSNIKDTPLLNAIDEHVPEGTKVFIKDMMDLLVSPVVKK